MSSVTVWVRLLVLPIEYYEPSVLRDIGSTIGEPLIKIIKTGGLEQPVQYEGINNLCFSCGRFGHKAESCQYRVRVPKKVGEKEKVGKEMIV